jgi:competence protein ComEC
MPYVRFTLAFFCGIVWQSHIYPLPFPAWILSTALFFVFVAVVGIPYFRRYYSSQWMIGLIGLLFLFSAGITIVQCQQTKTRLPLQQYIYIEAVVTEDATDGGRYLKTPVVVCAYADSNGTHAIREKTVLYLEADSTQIPPEAGDSLVARVRFSEFKPPQNPEEFDYRRYMNRRYVFTSGFVRRRQYEVVHTSAKSIRYLPAQMRRRTQQLFADKNISGNEYAVLNALTLGDKRDIDVELKQSYTATGAMHILAVSGLHVGIISGILFFVLAFLEKRRGGRILKSLLCIAFLWFYAAIVGFSPSVTRATVMCSFVLAGQMMRHNISIYNSLAASAFFICLFYPFSLFEAGFQLSYCAVLSIVYFQPILYRLLYFRYKYVDYFWQLVTVSFAAQIGTLPITLADFHQFPNYFLLTNMFVIPLTGLIVYFSATLVSLSWLPVISDIAAWCLNKLVWLLNSGIRAIEKMPFSVTSDIYISHAQVFLLIAIALLFVLYIEVKNRKCLWLSACLAVAFFAFGTQHSVGQQQQQYIAVYNVKNASYIHFVNGVNSVAFRDSGSINHTFDFNLKPFFITAGISEKSITNIPLHAHLNDTAMQHLHVYHHFIISGNKLIKILDGNLPPVQQTVPVDYLIVTAAAAQRPEQALTRYQPDKVILDASLPTFRVQQWEVAAHKRRIALHNVQQQGAWIQPTK